MGKPTIKGTKMTIRQFFIQPWDDQKLLKKGGLGVCSYRERRQITLIISSSASSELLQSARSNREVRPHLMGHYRNHPQHL